MANNGQTLGDKIRGWFDDVFRAIGEAIADFFHKPLELAMEWIMDTVGGEMYDKVNLYMVKKVEKGEISAGAKKELDDFMGELPKPAGAVIGFVVYMLLGPMIAAGLEPAAEITRHEAWSAIRVRRLLAQEVIPAAFKDKAYLPYVTEDLNDQGYTNERIAALTEAYRTILKEGDIRDLFLRGLLEGRTEDDLLDKLGYNPTDRDDLKKLFWTVPPLADMVRFADFSAFDPIVIEKWKDYFNCPSWLLEPFGKVGINDAEPDRWASRYWFSHWRQPGRFELGELHRRGYINDEDAKLAYKTMGYSGYWQDNLVRLIEAVPTRVDVRRFWDMGTIDEARLSAIYKAHGYYGESNKDYVTWTKINSYLPDAIQRWKRGWIGIDEIRAELLALGMAEARVDEVLETKINAEGQERTVKERDITKAEIIKGVKKDVITREEANILLQSMGYDMAEAAFILAINIPEDAQESSARKRELSKSDILRGLNVKLITSEIALEKLLDIRYTPADAAFILAIYEAVVAGDVEPAKREATKADIVKGVRKGLITPEQGYSMLLEIDFSPDASTFILMINIDEEPFSPHSYLEFLYITEWYKGMQGKAANPPPNDLILAEAAYNKARVMYDTLKEKKGPEMEITKATKALRIAEYDYGQKLVTWKEAKSKGQTGQ